MIGEAAVLLHVDDGIRPNFEHVSLEWELGRRVLATETAKKTKWLRSYGEWNPGCKDYVTILK